MRRFVRSHRVMAMLVAGGLLSGIAGGPPGAALGASGDPPGILFAGEALSAPSYDHIVLVYNTHLDETVPIPLGDFSITVDGAPHAPVGARYLLSGLVGIGDPFDESGTTFIRLDLPPGLTVGAASIAEVSYLPGPAPLRDLSLTTAPAQSVAAEFGEMGDFAFLAGVVDSGNATNRLTLIFTGQVDLGSIPAPADFAVSVDGSPLVVTAVEPREPDLGLGFVDLVLAASVPYGASATVAYDPGTNAIKARNGGLALDPIPTTEVSLFIPPTSASATVAAGGTVTTGVGVPPSPGDPLTTAVTSPNEGLVTIDETAPDPSPVGYTFFGQQVLITAPPASSANDPLVLVFQIDATLVPAGQDVTTIVVLRNGVPVANCTGLVGTADPSPCVASRLALDGGDIEVTVNTVAASRWNFAVVALYVFGGFQPPVNGGGVRNLANAGSAIPVRFSLGGNRGLAIFTSGSPASRQVDCDTSNPIDLIEQTVSAGASSLAYDAGNDTYTYVWKTDRAWATTCRQLTLSFGDGSQQSALFQFK